MYSTMNGSAAPNEFLEKEIERAMAPYKALLPPEALEEFREQLAHALLSHPVGSSYFHRSKPQVPPMISSEVCRDPESEQRVSKRVLKRSGTDK